MDKEGRDTVTAVGKLLQVNRMHNSQCVDFGTAEAQN